MNAAVTTEHKDIKIRISTVPDENPELTGYDIEVTNSLGYFDIYINNTEELVTLSNVINDFIDEYNIRKEAQI